MVVIPGLGHLIELAAVAMFVWAWRQARRAGGGAHIELAVAVAYGWLLEALDMLIFGTYHYGAVSWWWIADVPVYIPLLWALIVHSSMALSDRAGLPEAVRPWLDGLLAVLLDLAVDAIAIRLGLWHWRIRLDEGWFGVPPGNLYAWMWVAACYSGMMRLARFRIRARGAPGWHRWLVPPAAYAGLLSALMLMGFSGRLMGLETPDERLWLFAAHVAAFLAIVRAARRRPAAALGPVPSSLLWPRWMIHGLFFLLLWPTGLWRQVPALVAVSAGAILLEALAGRLCRADGTVVS